MLRKFWLGAVLASMSAGTGLGVEFDLQSYVHSRSSAGTTQTPVVLASCTEQGCDPCVGCDTCGKGCGLLGKGCDSGDCCDSLCNDDGLLGFGIVKKSEHCYDDFISPMTNPVYFEDPRQLSEVRAIFINHKLPYFNAIQTPGGRLQLYAMQIRARLTENLSLIATKDGYVVSQSPLLDDGWADLSAGLKYSLYRNASTGSLLSIGGRFEMPTGMDRTLQGNGDGVFDFFLSGGTRLGRSAHYLTGAGFILPVDSQDENQMFYWSQHLDKRIADTRMYLFTELNWYNYMKSASAFPLPVQGGDLFNLGSPDIAGTNIVTDAIGAKFKPNGNCEIGFAWEFPLTATRGILDNRITADLILRY